MSPSEQAPGPRGSPQDPQAPRGEGDCEDDDPFAETAKTESCGSSFLRVALRALGFFLAVNQRFEMVIAFLADVFEDRHVGSSCLLESICGEFANHRFCRRGHPSPCAGARCVGAHFALSPASLAAGRSCADHRQLCAPSQDPLASGRGASGRGYARNQSALLVPLAKRAKRRSADPNRGSRPRRIHRVAIHDWGSTAMG